MMRDYFALSADSIRHRSVRSWLTILGVVIGIAAIVSLALISEGLNNAIQDQFNKMGVERIMVMPKGAMQGGFMGGGLGDRDVDALENMPYFEYVMPMSMSSATIEYKGEKVNNLVAGMPTDIDQEKVWSDVDMSLEDGRWPYKNERGGVMVGKMIAHDVFSKELSVNSKLNINGKDFRVIAIFNEIGNPEDDKNILIELGDFKELFGQGDDYATIMLQAKSGLDTEDLVPKIERQLERSRDDENFEIMTTTQLKEQVDDMLSVVQVILVSISAISLVVGGVGIMNTMYTSVLERTKEIGTMKAIGAKNSDILAIFVIESSILGFSGGVAGAGLGAAIAYAVGVIAKMAGFQMMLIIIRPELLLFAVAFAATVGGVSGFMPARRAAQMSPADALK